MQCQLGQLNGRWRIHLQGGLLTQLAAWCCLLAGTSAGAKGWETDFPSSGAAWVSSQHGGWALRVRSQENAVEPFALWSALEVTEPRLVYFTGYHLVARLGWAPREQMRAPTLNGRNSKHLHTCLKTATSRVVGWEQGRV